MLNKGSTSKLNNLMILHLSWFAFFLTFCIWFSHAPLKPFLVETFNMSSDQWKALLILNISLTIPARVVIGAMVDRFGPRVIFSVLLFISGVLSLGFALASTFEQLAFFRFLLGFVGAGFVIGIRLIGEWFSERNVGLASGIYGGWGNFGSAAAAWILPSLAVYVFSGADAWRWSVATIGVIAIIYSIIFFILVRNCPDGVEFKGSRRSGGLEVSSIRSFVLYLLMNIPMYLVLAFLLWKLSPAGVDLIGSNFCLAGYVLLALLFILQLKLIIKANKVMLKKGYVPLKNRYQFKQVAILCFAYFATFGSELAVISMLPGFFLETFDGLSLALAGLVAGVFAMTNLFARPLGGFLSDKYGRRTILTMSLAGSAIGFLALAQINASMGLWLAITIVIGCSIFVQVGEGAVFSIVPLIKKPLTGQIAGMTGAYGNIGGVTFLMVFSFVDSKVFFLVIAACIAIVTLIVHCVSGFEFNTESEDQPAIESASLA